MPPSIDATGLRHRFGEHEALRGIDLEVGRGEVLALLGPNGAGKTTTVRVLTTQLRPDVGRATVAGHDVLTEPDAVRRRIGLAGQSAAVDERLTAHENLTLIGRLGQLPRTAAGDRADELLGRFGLAHVAHQSLRTFSGGMRRRIDLAAALVAAPPVLFLDEPTTGLDPAARAGLWEVLRALVADGTTLLLTTQYLEEAHRLADRVSLVDEGLVVAEGTSDELTRAIGDEVLELGLIDAAGAVRALGRVSALRGVEADAQGATLVVRARDIAPVLPAVLESVNSVAGAPTRVALRGPTLDDVFLALTGAGTAVASGPVDDPPTPLPDTMTHRPTELAGDPR